MDTDLQIQRDVQEELNYEPQINSAEIGVAVTDGIVTLTGNVPTYDEKLNAEKLSLKISGVRGLIDKLDVKPGTGLKKDDQAIAEAALNALKWYSLVPEEKIKVKVSDGWITLSGEVDWHFQSDSAFDAVKSLSGVTGVTNLITVKPRATSENVRELIEDSLKRNAELDAEAINVSIIGDKVILSGSLPSWHEREEAEVAAWAAPGVKNVENRIIITESSLLEEEF